MAGTDELDEPILVEIWRKDGKGGWEKRSSLRMTDEAAQTYTEVLNALSDAAFNMVFENYGAFVKEMEDELQSKILDRRRNGDGNDGPAN
jgi:predicted DNA-binding protein